MVIEIILPGLYTTVQDQGRLGFSHLGVSNSGAMVLDSFRLANLLVGNWHNAAALEMTAAGISFTTDHKVTLALVGAGWSLHFGDQPKMNSPVIYYACPSETIRIIRKKRASFRAYLAVRGGLDVPQVMNSNSTDSRAKLGGLQGRKLKTKDKLNISTQTQKPPVKRLPKKSDFPSIFRDIVADHHEPIQRMRIVPGPHKAWFAGGQLEHLCTGEYEISEKSNRVGYRLNGPKLQNKEKKSLLSEGLVPGALQVPAGGKPIMVMTDCQTMGGYPIIATTISADVNAAGRCGPGDILRFESIDKRRAFEIKKKKSEWWNKLQKMMDNFR